MKNGVAVITQFVLETYRTAFRPSAHQPEPYLVINADILIADTKAEARTLALSEA